MEIISTVAELQTLIKSLKKEGKTIGCVPTMGALHGGHIALTDASKKENDVTICTIFVNPKQFNEKSDLENYPRTLEKDAKLLTKHGVDIIFNPPVEEIYPKGLKTKLKLKFGGLDKKMEGEFRPGHFKGVSEVVKRLLDIVTPDTLYMGQKDFQQFYDYQSHDKRAKDPCGPQGSTNKKR